MTTAPDYEIGIVGGGPCGAATALFAVHAAPHLAERLVILDRARFPRDKICAGAIGARADRLLADIGAVVRVPAAPIAGLSVTTGKARLEGRLGGTPIGRVVRRREHDAALLDQVRARGVRVEDGIGVSGFEKSARGVLVHTTAGSLRVRALVGADGVGSVVRRFLGLPKGELYAQAVEIVTPRAEGDPDADLLHFDVSDTGFAGYRWDFPTVLDGELAMCRGVYELRRGSPAERGPFAPQDIGARLSSYLTERGIETAGLRQARFAERGLCPHQPFAAERVLLAGEAAGIDPVLGEGIAQAILYGATTGKYLARCAGASDYRFGDWRSTLLASRVGLDLRIRAAAVRAVYGRSRPFVERVVTRSTNLAACGMAYFAGRRVPRTRLALALVDALGCLWPATP